jgi:hypothetical protein
VLEAFRRGEFDQLEIIGQADEKEFFELCFKEKILDALAEAMPTDRKKEEVPRWFVLAANLSLKLHLENSFYAFERVVRCGGLLWALPAEIASKHLNPQTQQILLECRGFVDGKNITRCKQEWGIDVLLPMKRKMDIWKDAWALGNRCPWQEVAAPTPPPKPAPSHRPEEIVRRECKRQKTLAAQKAKEPPLDPAKVVVRTQMCPMKGFASWSECGVPLNVLLVRETYADGHQDQWALMDTADWVDPRHPMEQYGLRPKIEERHRILKCFHDLSDFCSRCFNVIVAQVVFILLSYTLRQWQLWKFRQQELAGKTPGFLSRQLNLHSEHVVIYHQNAYTRMPLVTFSRELLEMPAEARAKALIKVRQLEQSFLTPLENLRAPP